MNLLLTIMIFTGVDVYFLKDSPDLLMRVIPNVQTQQITLYYSFANTNWDSTVVKKETQFFDAILRTPDDPRVVGIYCVYDGYVDDNKGEPYLYELKIFPRMLMPFAISDIEKVVAQARKKINANIHIDEAITLLEYVSNILNILPVIKNSDNELKKNILQSEVSKLKMQVGR